MDYFDLGTYSKPVTTTSNDAQMWFDRGVVWTYGYNHEEAILCFEKALEADPSCAMAQWGIAYAIGPNYNLPWILFDPAAKAAELAARYRAEFAAPYLSAAHGYITDVIEPAETRWMVALALRKVLAKRELRPPKKHGNNPM